MNSAATPIALTIAGSDCSGGAGIQADLKTFTALGVYGASVLTALTAQNTTGVQAVHGVPQDFIISQMNSVFSDLNVTAIKIGMLGTALTISTVATALKVAKYRFMVLDPVMVATSGDPLLEPDAERALQTELIPMAGLITPNLHEAARLLYTAPACNLEDMQRQAVQLIVQGAQAVLIKGGHIAGDDAIDVLHDGREISHFSAQRIDTQNTHGTGCTLSSAIAAYCALGHDMKSAVKRAKIFVTEAIHGAAALHVGKGNGPLDHAGAALRINPIE